MKHQLKLSTLEPFIFFSEPHFEQFVYFDHIFSHLISHELLTKMGHTTLHWAS